MLKCCNVTRYRPVYIIVAIVAFLQLLHTEIEGRPQISVMHFNDLPQFLTKNTYYIL